jgi:hypothetical protein
MTAQRLDQIRFVTAHFNELQGLRYLVPLGLVTLSVGGTTYFENGPIRLLRAAFLLGGLFLMARAGRYYRRTFGEVKRQPILPGPVDSLSVYSSAGAATRLASSRWSHPASRWLPATLGFCFALLLTLRAISPAVAVSTDQSLVQMPWLTLNSAVAATGFTEPLPFQWIWPGLEVQMMYGIYGALLLGLWLSRGRHRSQSYLLGFGILLLGLSAVGAFMGFPLSGAWGPRMLQIFDTWFLPALAHLWVAVVVCGAAMILAGLMDHWQIVRVLGNPATEEAP